MNDEIASAGTAKSWLITGCSSGFGRCLAQAALKRGDRVLLTARSVDSLEDIASQYPDTAYVHRLDVTNPDDIASATQTAIKLFGNVDVIVNNAGCSILPARGRFATTKRTRCRLGSTRWRWPNRSRSGRTGLP